MCVWVCVCGGGGGNVFFCGLLVFLGGVRVLLAELR